MNIFATSVCTVVALCLWFIMRKKRVRYWFPLLAKLNVKKSHVPKFVWQRPPLLAFICFVCSALALVIYTFAPKSISYAEAGRGKLLLYIDFSPSVSAKATNTQYRQFLQTNYRRWQEQAQTSVYTSHSDTIHLPATTEAFQALLQTLTFHRHETIIYKALQTQTHRLQEYDNIIIVSDRDLHTWQNFHWQHLGDKIKQLPVPQLVPARASNLFLQNPTVEAQGVEVEVARAGEHKRVPFTLLVGKNKRILMQKQGMIEAHRHKTYVRLDYLPLTGEKHWLKIQSQEEDAIALDDIFYFLGKGTERRVVLVADLYGERAIDDPLFQLQTALEVLGMKVMRQDRLRMLEHDLLISAYDRNYTLAHHCPKSAKRLWLMPQTLGVNSEQACRCYLRAVGKAGTCAGKSWQQVLQQSGAIPLYKGLLWQKASVVVFTMPLYAYSGAGFSYAQIPVLLKQLLVSAGMLTHDAGFGKETEQMNVVRGESMLQEGKAFPPLYTGDASILHKEKKENSQLWTRLLLSFVLVAGIVELVFVRASPSS